MATIMGLVCLKPDLDIIENVERRDAAANNTFYGSLFDIVTYRKTKDDNVLLLWENLPEGIYESLIDVFAELVDNVTSLSITHQPYELVIAQGIDLTYETDSFKSQLKLHLNPRILLTNKEH